MDLFSLLREKAIQRHQLLMTTLELTYRCNLKCVHCYLTPNDPYRKEMPTDEWIRAIREMTELGAMYIVITGGEPTLYPGFWDILEELKRQNILIRLFTNATTLDEEDIDRLILCGVRYVDVSLYGSDAATHEAVTGVPGSFDRTVTTIKRLKAAGVHLNLKASILRSNHQDINRLYRLMRSLGGLPLLTPNVTPDNEGGLDPVSVSVGEEEICYLLEHFYQDYSKISRPVDPMPMAMRCSAGFATLTVAPNGEVIPCVQLRVSMGNVQRNSLRRIWHHSPVQYYVKSLTNVPSSDCANCELEGFCIRCPGLAQIETGSIWSRSPNACRYAAYIQTALERQNKHEGVSDVKEVRTTTGNQ